ncbi:hypothetical protein PanWU01x14_102170 [Parasponia andersonii]|uniref:Uncharacterized protein n=1 Tax=Parasponia andersonii TaxID=3476 RepID=A0A2P5D2Q6_PARAD|nr:hypothetical protein PanWU01x14_102170 [Parasponia andersonii]
MAQLASLHCVHTLYEIVTAMEQKNGGGTCRAGQRRNHAGQHSSTRWRDVLVVDELLQNIVQRVNESQSVINSQYLQLVGSGTLEVWSNLECQRYILNSLSKATVKDQIRPSLLIS